ncbi:MAG: sigma-70 family RNA polymerase sigma factor [Lachnospiraceae bacterium]|nr:sigma-70 family RNA polymerase sigma factor [Lachnospiraceae bacterium]
MEDKQIIELYFNRSEQAIEETSSKYGKLTRSVSYRIVRNEEDTDECVSDTYMALWNTIPPENPDPFVAYICRLARNISIKKLRYNTADKRNSFYDVSIGELEEVLTANSDVQKEIEAEELQASINSFLKTLKKTDRVIFVKRFWFNMTLEEISEETGYSKNYINVHLHRTKERLKAHLTKEGYYE